jgi:hypothetical protein
LVLNLIFIIQNSLAAVFEPLMQHLVAADLKYPHLWRLPLAAEKRRFLPLLTD